MADWALCEGRPNKQPHHILATLMTPTGWCPDCVRAHVEAMVDADELVPASMVREVLIMLRIAEQPDDGDRMTTAEVRAWLDSR